MLRRIIWILFMMNAVAAGEPKKKDALSYLKGTPEREELAKNIAALQENVGSLAGTVRHLQKEIELLKFQGDSLSATQTTQIKKIAEEVYKQHDTMGIVDQKVNALSLKSSQEINTLSEKVSNALSVIISLINAQQKLSNVVTGSETKQSAGEVYEVEANETLDSIATKFKTTKEAIKKLNFITDENHLPIGLMLFIPQTKFSSPIK
ncbi:MAG: LysM peptidoglycan-binding domain-containing protein [Puniceicoccales bacterium]|nr:LysM peptidoglycan-binding domain-containing protein [Puniceicoccales bacterium]